MASELERLMEVVVRRERGEKNPADDEMLRQALLRFAPSSETYRRISAVVPPPAQMGLGYSPQDQRGSNPLGAIGGFLSNVISGTGGPGTMGQGGSPGPSMFEQDITRRGPVAPETEDDPRDLNRQRMGMMLGNDFGPGGAPLAANPGLGYGSISPEQEAVDALMEMTAGYDFVGQSQTPQDIMRGADMLRRNPEALAHVLSGGDRNKEAWLRPQVESALVLASMGMLGGATTGSGTPGLNLASGPATDVGTLTAAEDFLDEFDAPGFQYVDPNVLYQDAFGRASATSFDTMNNPETGKPFTTEDIIDTTNRALLAATPFMGNDAQGWLSGTLNAAAVEYMAKLSTGEITMSYPAYLKSIGIDQMLSGA